MVAQAKSIETVVTTPFDARDTFRARPRSSTRVATTQVKPERVLRATAIDSNPNALSARRPHPRRGRRPQLRLEIKEVPPGAITRVKLGERKAYRLVTPRRISCVGERPLEPRR